MPNNTNVDQVDQVDQVVHLSLITRAYEAFARGDIPAVLAMFADELEHFGVVSDGAAKAPWHRPARTRDDVAAYFEALVGALEPLKFEFGELAAGGDFVYATTQQQYRVRRTGKILLLRDSVHRFKIVRGRIVGWFATEDTAVTAGAFDPAKEHAAIVDRAYQAFTRGDVPAILEMCAEKMEQWEVVSDGPDQAPWHQPARTRAEIAGFFQALVGAFEPVKFEWQHVAASGPYVYVTTQQEYRVRKTGAKLVMRDTMHRFKIVDGRVVGWVANEDSAQTRAALQG